MPLNEIENHPFLNLQQNSEHFNMLSLTKMVVGTFPIYEITDSIPLEPFGQNLKENFIVEAFFQYFYGSNQNQFWNIFTNCFNNDFPNSAEDCIALLNGNGVFITDCISSASRIDYKPDDSALRNINLNEGIRDILNMAINIETIIFTSVKAKQLFCTIVDIQNTGKLQIEHLFNRTMTLKTLPTPAGNGRSVPHYFETYPPTDLEIENNINNLPYAIGYRARLYCESLT